MIQRGYPIVLDLPCRARGLATRRGYGTEYAPTARTLRQYAIDEAHLATEQQLPDAGSFLRCVPMRQSAAAQATQLMQTCPVTETRYRRGGVEG